MAYGVPPTERPEWFWCTEDPRRCTKVSWPISSTTPTTPGGSTILGRYPQMAYQVAGTRRGQGMGRRLRHTREESQTPCVNSS